MKKFFVAAVGLFVLFILVLWVSSFLEGPYNLWRTLVYPPAAHDAKEVYPAEGEKLSFATFSAELKKYVKDGMVDYTAWKNDTKGLEATLEQLSKINLEKTARDHVLAAQINAYNAFTIKLMLEYWPIKSILDIPGEKRWNDVRWNFAGKTVSLDQLEHKMMRQEFIEPRIHFAIVCASIGCPPLASEAYEGEQLEKQLEKNTRIFFQNHLTLKDNTVVLNPILDWFQGDFVHPRLETKGFFEPGFGSKSLKGRLLLFAAKYGSEDKAGQIRENLDKWQISYGEYDWGANGK